MLKGLVRLIAFFSKEINEVRRQPRLVLSLVFGPFLILLLFGIGYRGGQQQPLRAALVIPDSIAKQIDVASLKQAAGTNYDLVSVTADEAAAMNLLKTGQVEVVEVIPPNIQATLERGEQVAVQFRHMQINPVNEAWLQYLGYAQVNEMNKVLLLQTTSRIQQEAKANQGWVAQAKNALDSLSTNLSDAELAQRQQSLRRLRGLVLSLAASPVIASQIAAGDQSPESARQELTSLASDLDALDQAISNRSLAQEQPRVQAARDRLARFQSLLETFSRVSPLVFVSPLVPTYQNLEGGSLPLTTFYAPGVLALILQHIAVTLGALSLVRERVLGSIELFRVAPVSIRQVLFGKYLAYTLFIGIIAAGLILLMQALQVPFRGSVAQFALVVFLLILGALGIGFLISTVSQSDTQAIQLSMLVLLLSIFFSGFFLPLSDFWLPVRAIGYLLPLTSALTALQDILLRGVSPSLFIWLILGGLGLATFVLVNLFAGRQLRFTQGSSA